MFDIFGKKKIAELEKELEKAKKVIDITDEQRLTINTVHVEIQKMLDKGYTAKALKLLVPREEYIELNEITSKYIKKPLPPYVNGKKLLLDNVNKVKVWEDNSISRFVVKVL